MTSVTRISKTRDQTSNQFAFYLTSCGPLHSKDFISLLCKQYLRNFATLTKIYWKTRFDRADMCLNCSFSVKSMKFGTETVSKMTKKMGYAGKPEIAVLPS